MINTKIYFLFALFLLIIVQSTSVDLPNRKDRKNYDNDDNNNNYGYDKTKTNRLNDDYSQGSNYRRDRNRYSPYSLSNNFRSRSRWSPSSPPSSYDDRYDSDDWSSYGGYGLNNLLSSFGGGLPPAAFDTGAYLGAGPSCYSLLDPQYPLFSDICGAVPQARYALPNSFGHIERWQIAQTLAAILNPATTANPVCTRSLRLLLCPLLFPPCPTRFEAPPVLPCQPYCRMVKSQCANPSLELLPCDLLPPTSDLCPINPTPYSSLLASYGQPSPLAGPLSPSGMLPQSPLSSLLAQSAFQSRFSPVDMPPPGLSSLLSPSSPFSSMMSSPPYPSPFAQTLGPSSPFPSMMSSSPFPSMMPSSRYSSPLPQGVAPPSGLSSLLSSLSPLFNMDSPNPADTLTPILVDFPPVQYMEAASRFLPLTRSATEQV